MKKYFLLLVFFASLFYLSQNASAATKYACDVCSTGDTCASYYSSGNTCYYGISCQYGYLLDSQKVCLSVSTPYGGPAPAGTLECPYVRSLLDGYVYQDSSNPVTDSQCQNKICGSSGWYAQNKPDNTPCTYNGQPSTCKNGKCQSPLCSATLSVSSSGTAPCTVSASVSGTGCDGQTFEVKDSAGNSKCSGVITAGSGSCSSWSISADTAYNLFIPSGSATPVDTKTASCGTPCSSYSAQSSCQSGGCYWCASPNTPGNTCVQSSSQCTPPASCSAWNNNAGNCNSASGCYYCGIYGTCLSIGDTSCPGFVNCASYTSSGACASDGGSGGTPKPACTWCPNSLLII